MLENARNGESEIVARSLVSQLISINSSWSLIVHLRSSLIYSSSSAAKNARRGPCTEEKRCSFASANLAKTVVREL